MSPTSPDPRDGLPAPRPPADFPAPPDDGAADHLPGLALPARRLTASSGAEFDRELLAHPRTVLFVYPRMSPVFPPDTQPAAVAGWLTAHPVETAGAPNA